MNEDIDAAQGIGGSLQPVRVSLARHVETIADDLVAARLQGGHGLLHLRRIARKESDVGTLIGKQFERRAPEPTTSAGQNHLLAVKSEFHE